MTPMHTRPLGSTRAWLTGLALTLAGFSAQAQMGGMPMQGGQGAMPGPMAERVAQMRARHTQHLQELKGKLQLTPAQESAWTSFSSAMQPPAMAGGHEQHRQDMASLSTPERLDRMKAMRTQRQAEMNGHMDRRAEATKAFYATLTPEQKKVFDTETARMMQPGGHGPQGRGGHQHGGGSEHGQHGKHS